MPDIFVQKATAFTEDSLLFRRANDGKTWDGCTYTVGSTLNDLGSTGSPVMLGAFGDVTEAATDRVYMYIGQLNPKLYWREPMLLGATAYVLRVRNEKLVVVGEGTVTGGKIGRYDLAFAAGTMVTGTSAEIDYLRGWHRVGVPYWAGVAAVNAAGEIGPIAWDSFTLPTQANSGTATNTTATFTPAGSTGALSAPANVSASQDGTDTEITNVSWDAVTDAVGYVLYMSIYDPATEISPDGKAYVDLDTDGLEIKVKDLVVINKKMMTVPIDNWSWQVYGIGNQTQLLARTMLNDPGSVDWEWLDLGTPPMANTGKYAVRLNLDAGESCEFKRYFAANMDHDGYITMKTDGVYRQEIVHRSSGDATIQQNFSTASNTITPTGSWQKTTLNFTPETVWTAPGVIQGWTVTVTAGAAPVSVDIIITTWDTARPFATTGVTDVPSGTFIREHSKIKPGAICYDVDTLTEPSGRGARFSGTINTDYILSDEFDCDPWMQIEPICGMQDFWQNLLAYWVAPEASGNAYALKRAAQGALPLQDRFDKVRLEVGNEAWNIAEYFIALRLKADGMVDEITERVYASDEVMGMWVALVDEWMRASPYWDLIEDKFEWTISGWFDTAANPSQWGIGAIEFLPENSTIGIANYVNGWESQSPAVGETGEGMIKLAAFVPPKHTTKLGVWQAAIDAANTLHGKSVGLIIYEGNPGYAEAINSNDYKVDVIPELAVNKSIVAGQTTLDATIEAALNGVTEANVFALGASGSPQGRSHRNYKYGAQPRPDVAIHNIIQDELGGRGNTLYPLKRVKEPTRYNEEWLQDIKQISGAWIKSGTIPGRWLLALGNRAMDRSVLDEADEYYDAEDTGIISLAVRTGFASISAMRTYDFGIGNPRLHNAFKPGYRPDQLNDQMVTDTVDPLCVTFDLSATDLSVPADVSRIVIDDSVGASAGGLSGGNFLILAFDGVTLAA